MSFILVKLAVLSMILLACAGAGNVRTDRTVAPKVLIGAIRWDGWQENGEIQAGLERVLGAAHWHYRLPFFARITGSNSVVMEGNSQAILDREINYAANAGIDYWAFDIYPDTLGMSNALHLYLRSTCKRRINFALNLQGGWISKLAESWSAQVIRYVEYFKDPSYQKVLGNRPLVYLYTRPNPTPTFPDAAAVAAAFDQLRAATTNAGLGNPYIVFQGWSAGADFKTIQEYKLDALGAYAVLGKPDATLASVARQFWESGKATGAEVVPIVSSGWDNQPFKETQVPWYPQKYIGGCMPPVTPAELADHLADALYWTHLHRATATPANTVLIYAWNENAEGGWLVPSLNSDGSANTDRLAAITAMLRSRTTR